MVQDIISVIEKRNDLYSIQLEGYHIWDGIRYNVISFISENEAKGSVDDTTIAGRPLKTFLLKEFLSEGWSYFRNIVLPRSKREVLFLVSSRYKDGDKSYDRQIVPFLSRVPAKKRIILEYQQGAKYSDKHYSDASPLYYRIAPQKIELEKSLLDYLAFVINSGFEKQVITSRDIDKMINRFFSACSYYEKLLNNIAPKKIFISYGRFKAITAVALKMGIPVYLIQHALIFENDYALANTCPDKSLGFFPNMLLTYGNYWGQYMKNLVDVRVLGNEYLSRIREDSIGNAVLFISTPKQGLLLGPIAKSFAERTPSVTVLYRLHPSEYSLKFKYLELFKECSNVRVVTNDESFEESLEQSKLVVGIFSTALYEALHQKRTVAVLNSISYQTYLSNLKGLDNVYFFSNEEELGSIYSKDNTPSKITFFEPLNEDVIRAVLK